LYRVLHCTTMYKNLPVDENPERYKKLIACTKFVLHYSRTYINLPSNEYPERYKKLVACTKYVLQHYVQEHIAADIICKKWIEKKIIFSTKKILTKSFKIKTTR